MTDGMTAQTLRTTLMQDPSMLEAGSFPDLGASTGNLFFKGS
jgi:hypothetical protein